RWHPVAPLSPTLLPAGEGPQSALPPPVPRRVGPRVHPGRPHLCGGLPPSGVAASVAPLPGQPPHDRMGGLREGAPPHPTACLEVSGPLYASRGDLQPAAARPRKRPGELALQGLSAWPPASHAAPRRRGIPPPLPAACLAARLPTDSAFRLLGESGPPGQAGGMSGTARAADRSLTFPGR